MVITHNTIPQRYLSELRDIENLTLEQDDLSVQSSAVILYDVEPDFVANRIAMSNREQIAVVIVPSELTNKLMYEYYNAGATVVCDYAITPSALKSLLVDIFTGETYNLMVRKKWSNKLYTLSEHTKFSGTSGTVYTFGKEIELNNKEHEILQILLDNQGEYISKEILLTTLWGEITKSGSRSFDVYINRLRHILENDDDVDIRKIRGVGYAIVKGEENRKIKNKY